MRQLLAGLLLTLAMLTVAGCGASDEGETSEENTPQSLAESAKEACRDTGRAPATAYGIKREGPSLRLVYSGLSGHWPCGIVVLPSSDGLEVSVNRSMPVQSQGGERVTWCVDAELPARVSKRKVEIAVRREPSKAEREGLRELLRSGENCIPTELRLINPG